MVGTGGVEGRWNALPAKPRHGPTGRLERGDLLDSGSDTVPLRVLMDIMPPRLVPEMPAGWLLVFTLSPDDLVIASFVTSLKSSRQAP